MAHCTEQNAVEMGLKSYESIKELWRCENNDATHVILSHSVHTYEVTEWNALPSARVLNKWCQAHSTLLCALLHGAAISLLYGVIPELLSDNAESFMKVSWRQLQPFALIFF